MITLCMIVKDEAETIRNCLASALPYVSEIVVVDTGSKDDTKKIAREFTEKIYDFQWCNDFSAARNYSVSKASNDWILVLDADEVIEKFDVEEVGRFVTNPNHYKAVGRISIENIVDSESEVKKYVERVSRLFSKSQCCYEGTIHEQLRSKAKKSLNLELVPIYVNHIGYTKEYIHKKNKMERNIKLLDRAISKNPQDLYLQYQKGKAYSILKNYNEACKCFEKVLSFPLNYKLEYVEDLVENYGYALLHSAQYEKALQLEMYSQYYEIMPDFNFLLALIYMNNGKFKLAAETFLKCTQFERSKMQGITTYLSYYNIGVIFECLGLREQAIEYYEQCSEYKLARNRLKVLETGGRK